MMYNIGDTVVFEDYLGERKAGKICEVSSDMDSYENMKVENDIPMYWSKKLSKYVPVKEKNIDSVFFTVKRGKKEIDYVTMKDILSND